MQGDLVAPHRPEPGREPMSLLSLVPGEHPVVPVSISAAALAPAPCAPPGPPAAGIAGGQCPHMGTFLQRSRNSGSPRALGSRAWGPAATAPSRNTVKSPVGSSMLGTR